MKTKRLLWCTATLLAAFTAVTLASKKGEKPVRVVTSAVSLGDIEETVTAGGRIHPVSEIEISAEVSGEIVRLDCFDGKIVRTGDTLLVIKQEPYIAEVRSAEAALGVLEAEYRQHRYRAAEAAAAVLRLRRLSGGGGVSAAELQKAEADSAVAAEALEAAFHSVRRGKAALEQALENLALTTVISPMNGTVTLLAVKKGERIVGTSQMAGTLILKIADLNRMELRAEIGENDIASIHVGDSASISVEAFRGAKLDGIVKHIANSSKFIDGSFGQVANFEVRIEMPDSGGKCLSLKPGMSATADICASRRIGVPRIPVQCIFIRDRKECVWVVDENGRAHMRQVTTGIQDLDFIEVTSGLEEGEKVVSAPAGTITTGLAENMKTTE